MKMQHTIWIISAVFLTLSLLIHSGPAQAQDLSMASGDRLAEIALGGRLYDKWYAVLDLDEPKGTHSAYPASGKYKGASTWRCKECHGWDGLGKDGAYRKGKHFTGIVGVRGLVGAPEAKVVDVLKDDNHRLGGIISANGMKALAVFVTAGQLDMNRYIDRETKAVKGDLFRGKRFYSTLCASCHGADGKKINFGSDKKPNFLGAVARSNPWETLHKLRNGQPGEEMPSMLALSVQNQIDILAYTMKLPK